MSEAVNEKREPSTGMSFAVFGISIAIILLGVVVLGFDIHIILLVALAFACLVLSLSTASSAFCMITAAFSPSLEWE